MNWGAYKLAYRAAAPVHIGWHTLGYINLTRFYIPGKNIWGALTANFARMGKSGDPHRSYREFGEIFREDILPSYFFPAIDPDAPLMPEYSENGLRYGGFSRYEFERLLIGSFGQTAVLPGSNTAEEGSLHESEFMVPVVERGKELERVYFVGYLFYKEDLRSGKKVKLMDREFDVPDVLSEIHVGGDRKYGWGKLVLDHFQTLKEKEDFFGYELKLDGTAPKVIVPESKPIPAHVPVEWGLGFKGDIEPLVGREWGEGNSPKGDEKKSGFGQRISKAVLSWVPGSILLKKGTFHIGEYGILFRGAGDA